MAILSREAILGAQDLRRVTISVKEWGGEVILQEMNLERRVQFERELKDNDDWMRCLAVAYSAVDEQGELLFSIEHVQELGKKNFKPIIKLSNAVFKLNSLREQEIEQEKANF
jgi:hypothetical protein